jgi:hypothetical protein
MLPTSPGPDIGHPQGDRLPAVSACQNDTFPIETCGGVFHVRYDPDVPVSAMGGVAPFAQFLEATHLFRDWVAEAPVTQEPELEPHTICILEKVQKTFQQMLCKPFLEETVSGPIQ